MYVGGGRGGGGCARRTCNDEERGVGAGQVEGHQGLGRVQAGVHGVQLPPPQHLQPGLLPREFAAHQVAEGDPFAGPATRGPAAPLPSAPHYATPRTLLPPTLPALVALRIQEGKVEAHPWRSR